MTTPNRRRVKSSSQVGHGVVFASLMEHNASHMRSTPVLSALTLVTLVALPVFYAWQLFFYPRVHDTPAWVALAGVVGLLSGLASIAVGSRQARMSASKQPLLLATISAAALLPLAAYLLYAIIAGLLLLGD